MSPESSAPPPLNIQSVDQPPVPSRSADAHALEAMEKDPVPGTTFDALLRRPGQVCHELDRGRAPRVALILGAGLVACLAVFGVLLGSFSGGTQWWAAPLKIIFGMLLSGVICLPSLYIFGCLGGAQTSLRAVAGLLLAALTLTGLMLLALAPVVWLFAQSSESIVFFGALVLAFWLISLFFGMRLLVRVAARFGLAGVLYLGAWMLLFLLVSLQMSTALRPIVGTSPQFLPVEKKFFLEHWFGCVAGKSDR